MRRMSVELRYGRSTLEVVVPPDRVSAVLSPKEPLLPVSESEEIDRALDNPIGSGRIEEIARPGKKTVIMVSDMTRPSPSSRLLPPLLSRLSAAGVGEADVTLVFGMGIHRHMTHDEKKTLVGADVYSKYRCVESTEGREFVSLGTTSRGTPIEVCPEVAACDLLICTGNIEYHYFAGYTGGVKAVLPGACSRRTVEANHAMQLLPGAELGSYENNPVRQDMEEAGRVIGVDYILNVVLDEKKRIVRAVAGDPSAAHAVGRRVVDDLYGVPIDGEVDVVLVSAGGHPKDVNVYQVQKALDNAARAVRAGGTIVLLAECPEGLGEPRFEEYMTSYPLDEIIERIRARFVLGGHKAAAVARTLKRSPVYLVSAIEPELVRACKMTPFGSAQEAVNEALEKHGADASVLIMPYGGSTAPFPRR